MRAILGIDPGITGALALYDPDKSAESGMRWLMIDMPVVGGDKQELNAPSLRDFLNRHDPAHAFLERANTMPGQGIVGAFRYGGVYFAIRAVLSCCSVPYTLVTPQVWKKYHGVKSAKTERMRKEHSRQIALMLFPDQSKELARIKDHNKAEAMLIAAWGSAKLKSENELFSSVREYHQT